MQLVFGSEPMSIKDAKLMNAQVLAFVGDGVHTLFVRQKISINSNIKSGGLHKIASSYVKAGGQSEVINLITNEFSEDELSIYKRARNYKTQTQAKNASVMDYRKATGFEAVIGYLFLTGQHDRLNNILELSFKIINKDGNL